MKKHTTKFLTLLLMSVMTIGMFSLEAFAAPTDANAGETGKKGQKISLFLPEKAARSAYSADAQTEVEEVLEEAIFQDRGTVKFDVDTNIDKKKLNGITKSILKDNGADTLVTVTYDEEPDGTVTKMNVERDAAYVMAVDELEEMNENAEEPATQEEWDSILVSYAELQTTYEAYPQYFGVPTPYFYFKDTEATPVESILSIMGVPREYVGVPGVMSFGQLNKAIQGFNQLLLGMALPQEGQQYSAGDAMLQVVQQALAQLDDTMAPEEKMLVLNEWLASYCTFDMASLEKEGEQPDIMESTSFGALLDRKCICLGYTSAYNLMVQYAFPEIYKNEDGSWKTKDEVNGKLELVVDDNGEAILDSEGKKQYKVVGEQSYIIDFVKIQWQSKVEMLGQEKDFYSPHFFSAANVDEKWYYIDSCYNDIYVECLKRNRVETDGNVVHSYFLVSDTTLRDQFKNNYEYIDTLYEDKATNTDYEEAWFTKAIGTISKDKDNWYYIKNTSTFSSAGEGNFTQGSDQLIKRSRNTGEETVLVDYGKDTDAKEAVKEGAELVKDGAAADAINAKKYPELMHTAALYENALYLNVDNKILKYDLKTDTITKVKEYNKVSVIQDKENEFTGMAYTVKPEGTPGIVHTVENHPLAAICIKDDGKMYASIATNYAKWSGYTEEETNYNSSYINYNFDGEHIARGGDNDNQEFMWSANFVEILDMAHVAGNSHTSYETVTVAPTCEEAGFTEERCTTCGAIKPGSRKVSETALATGHHYVEFKDTTFAKNEDGSYKVVDAVVCTDCLDAFGHGEDNNDLVRPENVFVGHDFDAKDYTHDVEWSDHNGKATMTLSCDHCLKLNKELDFLTEECITPAKDAKATVTSKFNEEGKDCATGGTVTHTATLKVGGKTYTATMEETVAAESGHTYVPEFVWTKTDTGYTCEAIYKCSKGDGESYPITANVTPKTPVAATCTADGNKTYTATATLLIDDKEIPETTYTEDKVDVIPATGHSYTKEPTFAWSSDYKTCKATYECSTCKATQEVDAKVTSTVTKDETCTEAGEVKLEAKAVLMAGTEEITHTDVQTLPVSPTGHKYIKTEDFAWKEAEDGYTCKATYKCVNLYCDDTQVVDADVDSETVEATCTKDGKTVYTATAVLEIDGKEVANTKSVAEKTVIIPATKHDYITPPEFTWNEKDYTCTALVRCGKCKDDPEEGAVQEVPCKVTNDEEETNFDCEKGGTITYTATAEYDGKEYVDDKHPTRPVSPQPHTYKADFHWNKDYTCTVDLICTLCGDDPVKQKSCEVTSSITKNPTCTTEGVRTYKATYTFEGKDYPAPDATEPIPATGHSYGEPTFTWSTDNSMCTATFKCTKNDHTKTEKCIVSKNVTDATYTQAGSIVYKATYDKYSNTKVVTIPKKDAQAKFAKSAYGIYSTQTGVISIVSNYKEDKIAAIKSSDTKKLAVSRSGAIRAGKVTGKSVSVTVTATTTSGATIRTRVVIKPARVTLVTKSAPLQLKKTTTDIKIKDKSFSKDSVYKWTSSNKKVAEVNSRSGKIKAKKTGSATITVIMKSGAKASCRIKVQKSPVRLSKLAVSKSKVTLYLKGGSKTYQIATAKSPVTVSSKVTYSSSKKSVATVSKSGKITAKKAGTATITVRCSNKKRTIKVTVKKK